MILKLVGMEVRDAFKELEKEAGEALGWTEDTPFCTVFNLMADLMKCER